MENKILVSYDSIITEESLNTSLHKYNNFIIQLISKTPTVSESETICRSFIRGIFLNTKLLKEIINAVAEPWRKTLRSRYKSVLRRCFAYAPSQNLDPCTPNINTVLSFMHDMYINGSLHSILCAVRSVLCSIVTIKGYVELLICLSFAIHNRHQFLAKYTSIWGIPLLLDYLNSIEMNDKLQFKNLLKKTVMLFMIFKVDRKQALFAITINSIVTEDNEVLSLQNKTLKQTNTNRPFEILIY